MVDDGWMGRWMIDAWIETQRLISLIKMKQ